MIHRCLALLLLGFALLGPAGAETAQEKGLRIANTAADKGKGFGSIESVGDMTLQDRQGVRSARRFRTKAIEMKGGDRFIIVFERPRDIAGTAVLTHARKNRADDQWLYLPDLKRVKRISSGARTSSFAGSEFSYEDLSSAEVGQYTYQWLRDEPCPGQGGLTCYVVARFPLDKNSGYSQQTVWLDQQEYRLFRNDFFNRSGAHVKRLTASNYRKYDGRFWLANRLLMTNLRTGKSTVMQWTDRDFSVNLKPNDFTQRALRRAR